MKELRLLPVEPPEPGYRVWRVDRTSFTLEELDVAVYELGIPRELLEVDMVNNIMYIYIDERV
jgi:hypothetical protein